MAVSNVHVDRDAERALFRSMLERRCRPNVLLIHGRGGIGKTSLLFDFWQDARDHRRARIDLKATTLTVSDILQELVDSLGGTASFPRYQQLQFQEFARAGDLTIQHSDLKEVAVNLTPDVGLRTVVLTDAFFQDLADSGTPPATTALILDSFHEASPEVQGWLSRRFLRLARSVPHVTVVISGRSVPEVAAGWDDWCVSRELPPLERDHIREYMHRIDVPYEEATIDGIFAASQGLPYTVATAGAYLKGKQGGVL